MFKYILGIDGGGTKTLGVLYDLEGNEIKRQQFEFSNFSVDEELSKKTIINLIDNLLTDINDKVFVQMGIAGATRLQNKEAFILELEKRFNIKAGLQTDAHIALYSTPLKEDEKLIMAIGGTGSIIMTYDKGKTHRLGGWGHILGDEGSAYHLSIRAVKNILKEYEEERPYSYLSEVLMAKMNAQTPSHIIDYIYGLNKNIIALLSLEVQLASKKDAFATKLLKEEAELLAKQILKAYHLFIKKGKTVISLRGSFAQKALYVSNTIVDILTKKIKDVRFDIDDFEPIYGAYRLGLENILGGHYG